MTEIKNCQSQVVPAYSGITINITSPVLNASPLNSQTSGANYNAIGIDVAPEKSTQVYSEYKENKYVSEPDYRLDPNGYYSKAEVTQNMYNGAYDQAKKEYNNPQAVYYAENTLPNTNNNIYLTQTSQNEKPEIAVYKAVSEEKPVSETNKSFSQTVQVTQTPAEAVLKDDSAIQTSYPSTYYINNYNNESPSNSQQTANQPVNKTDDADLKTENTTYNMNEIKQDNYNSSIDDIKSPYYTTAFDKFMPQNTPESAKQAAETTVSYPAYEQTKLNFYFVN